MGVIALFVKRPYFLKVRSFAFSLIFIQVSSALLVGTCYSKTLIFQSDNVTSPDQVNSSNILSSETSNPLSYSTQASSETKQTVTTNSNAGNSQLFFMLEQLQNEIRQLRGRLEEQENQLHLLKQSSKSRYRDLDSRVLSFTKKIQQIDGIDNSENDTKSSLEFTTSMPSSITVDNKLPGPDKLEVLSQDALPVDEGANVPVVLLPPTPEQKEAYQRAYSLIKDKKFDQAITQLHAFINKYPQGVLTGNAYYWLGEVYLVLPQLEQAKEAFTIVVKSFVGHPKVADALFKLGVCYDRLQQPALSEKYLNEVQSRFPTSTAAKLAKSYKINR